MVSAAGRGKPRPLLAGVFRKACDYCVRSKRGCNGGTPCEQCIRREQPCTYSQRRKSGPRGRPVRQQSATPPPPSCSMLGVRTSSRRTKGTSSFSARDRSPEPSTVSSPSSSPNRVASVSSSGSSSPSDYSASDDSFSDSETEAFTEADQEQEVGGVGGGEEEEEEVQSAQKAKKSKISGPKDGMKEVREVSPSVPPAVSPNMLENAATATAAAAAAAAPSLVAPRPQLAAVSFSRPSAMVEGGSGSVRTKKEVAWQPRTLSPSTVAPPSLHHHPHRAAPSSNNGSALIHEISMQPWEFSRSGGARPVIASPPPLLLPSSTSGSYFSSLAGVSMDITDASLAGVAASASVAASAAEAGPMPMRTSAVLRGGGGASTSSLASSSSSSSSFDGALRLEGEDFCDDDVREEDFNVGLECADWEMPSLTREMSLARVVEALGGEHSTQGIGFEGSLVSGW